MSDPLIDDDATVQAAVMSHLLDVYPAPLSLQEVLTHFLNPGDGFAERDAIERAVRDLAHAGLLHRHGGLHGDRVLVMPTRAAVVFSELPFP